MKRCYLCFSAFRSEDFLYCFTIHNCTDCVDCVGCKECTLCHKSHDLTRCYAVKSSRECHDSQHLFGCYDCRSCHDCFGCAGLSHAKFCAFNKALTEEAYQAFVSAQDLDSYTGRAAAEEECRRFIEGTGHRSNTLIDCNNATGAYLLRCEDVVECYNGLSSTHCGYLFDLQDSHYCYRGYVSRAEFCHTASTLEGAVNAFCSIMGSARCNTYCTLRQQHCNDCFGCVALRGKSYCVLNKQYTKAEYLDLVLRVVAHMKSTGEWGRFFDLQYAPTSYENSAVHDFLEAIPLETARARGYRLIPEPKAEPQPGSVRGSDLPDRLNPEIGESLLSKGIVCERTGRPFNFQRREIEFYFKNGMPLPRRHWNERIQELINKRQLIPAV